MHKILRIVAGTLAAAPATGCQEQAKPAAVSRSVLDVQPVHRPTPAYTYSPQQVTPPEEPRADVATVPLTTVTPLAASTGRPTPPRSANSGQAHSAKLSTAAAKTVQANSYKVRKGDTLYHIAKTEYGDGAKWTLIASANPGVSPQSLKAGQTLLIP